MFFHHAVGDRALSGLGWSLGCGGKLLDDIVACLHRGLALLLVLIHNSRCQRPFVLLESLWLRMARLERRLVRRGVFLRRY